MSGRNLNDSRNLFAVRYINHVYEDNLNYKWQIFLIASRLPAVKVDIFIDCLKDTDKFHHADIKFR